VTPTEKKAYSIPADSIDDLTGADSIAKDIHPAAPTADPKGRQYDPSKKCAYHSGAPGHDTQDCWTLKHKIQNMIDSGEIVVKAPEQPNVNNNPLPQHNAEGVNMIGAGSRENRKYLRKLGEAPAMIDPSIWGYPEERYTVEQSLASIKVQVDQLAELIVYQHQVTRQLIDQVLRGQISTPSPKVVPILKRDQIRLQEQSKWTEKMARESRFHLRREFAAKRKFTPLGQSREEILCMLISEGKITEFLPSPDPR